MAPAAAFLPTSAARLPATRGRAALCPARCPAGALAASPPRMMAEDEKKKGGFRMPDLKSMLGPKQPVASEAPATAKKAAKRSSRSAAAQATSELNERGTALFKRDIEDKLQGGPAMTAKPTAGEPGYKDPVLVAEAAAKEAKAAARKKEESPSAPLPNYLEGGSGGGDSLLPDYLRPIPEDTPAEGTSWKNY